MFSSKSAEWETPKWLFDKLDAEFNFTLDPCSTDENHLCNKYYTIKDNGLAQDWSGEIVYVNPPYGNVLKDWVKKCHDEYMNNNTTVVMLIPARTDTIAQHEYIFKKASIVCFIRGRLKFANKFIPKDKITSAPFPSQIVIYTDHVRHNVWKFLSEIGVVIPVHGYM